MTVNIVGLVSMETWEIIGPLVGVILGALVTFIGQLFTSFRRISADLKAKTRLEWIKEVRELTVEIIYTAEKMKDLRVGSGEYNDNMINLKKHANLFKLYFAVITKEKNEKSYYAFSPLQNMVFYKKKRVSKMWLPKDYYFSDANIAMHHSIDELINNIDSNLAEECQENFRFQVSNYLKREWDIAKENN